MQFFKIVLFLLAIFQTSLSRAATLATATHHSRFELKSGTMVAKIWLPLPINYATQVPLSIQLEVSPSDLSYSRTYTVDAVGNFGVWLTFAPSSQAPEVTLHVESIVLILDTPYGERGEFYQTSPYPPSNWSHPTEVVASNHSEIRTTALSAAQGATNSFDAMAKVQTWISENIKYGFPGALDAITAFNQRTSTCTGYANLTAAMGRALNIPTRTIAGYLIGIPQQTHSVNEFYINQTWGWWRLEPQAQYPYLADDYIVAVRINHESDEQGLAMVTPYRPGMAAPGTPLYSLIELEGEARRVHFLDTNYFLNCDSCDNSASKLRTLAGDYQLSKRLFRRARSLWLRDQAQYTSGSLNSDIERKRRDAYHVQDLSDLDGFLSLL